MPAGFGTPALAERVLVGLCGLAAIIIMGRQVVLAIALALQSVAAVLAILVGDLTRAALPTFAIASAPTAVANPAA